MKYAVFHSAILTVLLLTAQPASTRDEIAGPSPFQFGMEIEISGPIAMRNLIPYYEIKPTSPAKERAFVETSLSTEEIDAYLTPDTFRDLPEALKLQLTEGLEKDVTLVLTEKTVYAPASGIQIGDQKIQTAPRAPTPSAVQLPGRLQGPIAAPVRPEFRTSSGIILNEAESPPKELVIPESVKQEMKWKTIVERWKLLPPSERHGVVRLEGLPPNKKAELWLDRKIPGNWIQPKESNDPKIKALLSNIGWTHENYHVIEFRHKVPMNGKEAYLSDVELFADLAGIRKYMNDPNSNYPPEVLRFSYHVHASRRGASLEKVADRANKLLLLEMYQNGRGDSALRGQFGFSTIYSKGLLKLVKDDHLEYRSHFESPRAELERYIPYMSGSASETVARLDAEIAAHAKKIFRELQETLIATSVVPVAFDYKARTEKIDTMTMILKRIDHPLKTDNLRELIGVPLDSPMGQARLLKLLETPRESSLFETVIPLLSKETLERQFENLFPLANSLNRMDLLYTHAVTAGIEPTSISGRITDVAFKALRDEGGVAPEAFKFFSPEERLRFIDRLFKTEHPVAFQRVRGVFQNLPPEQSELIGRRIIETTRAANLNYEEFESIAKSLAGSGTREPYEAVIKAELMAAAIKEKTMWNGGDIALIDSFEIDNKATLMRIVESPAATDTARERALKRLFKLEVPLKEIPLKQFFETTEFKVKFDALDDLLSLGAKSTENKRLIIDLFKHESFEFLMLEAKNRWIKFKDPSILKYMAFEAVKRPMTESSKALVDYITWSMAEVYKDPNSMKTFTTLVEGIGDPEWTDVLIRNLSRYDYRYFPKDKLISKRDRAAIAKLLELNFRHFGEDASHASMEYQSLVAERDTKYILADAPPSLKALADSFTKGELSRSSCEGLYKVLRRLKRP